MNPSALIVVLVFFQSSADSPRPVISLFGETLKPVSLPDSVLKERLTNLNEALAVLAEFPDDPDAIIWAGRRTAYLGRYHEAIDIFTRGIERHPDDARMYRHRGHRYITTRQFALAIDDLEKAAALIRGQPDEVEPDGLPNARNIPTSTLQSNIWYHLGLARYLTADYESAEEAYRACLLVSVNNDMIVATMHWLFMTLRRLGHSEDAVELLDPVHEGMEIIENDGYYRLLLFYKGMISQDQLKPSGGDGVLEATIGYGIAAWNGYNGKESDQIRLLGEILCGEQWGAFGFIAAEADVAGYGGK